MYSTDSRSSSSILLPASSLEIKEIQEEMVKLNLKIKMLNEEFSDCRDDRDMEALNEDVRKHLEAFRVALKKLEAMAKSQRELQDREMLLKDVDSHRDQMNACQKQFRQANLRCILELQKRDKGELFGEENEEDENEGVKRRRRSLRRNSLVKETGDVTDNLASISRQLAATVQRSALTVDDLASSSQTVSETKDEYKNMGSVIGQSRKLITKYGRRETTDRVLIFFAFAFFFAVVFYVLRKRVLGPLDPLLLSWNAILTLVNTILSLFGF